VTSARLLRTLGAPIPARRGVGAPGAVSAWWLGQAGFLLEAGGARVLVDPYLSDTLAEKYRGTQFPHVRLSPPPIEPGALRDVDLVLATHAHTDHLDPGTLGPLARANPGCRFVVPAAHAALATSRGVPRERLVPASAFAPLTVAGVSVQPIPSAHEALARDASGEHLFLGYMLELGGATVYHSGDCVPYPDLLAHLGLGRVDLALLPVNGRDAVRAASGVPGNFTLDEAMDLAAAAGFGAVVGHHFGLFDFNTIDVETARARIAARPGLPPFLLAEPGIRYDLAVRPVRDLTPSGSTPP
jgi:L-ascorbate metabolism protein UlaG (beta-lactamase superfamily)